MKLTSWNVNSVRARITNILAYIKESSPDILFLQEIKTQDENFPYEDFKNIGYNSYVFGQKSYNGVAIISNDALSITVLLNKTSLSLVDSSKLKLYLKPEQPPPFTEILKYFFVLFSAVIFLICFFARSVNSIFFIIIS